MVPELQRLQTQKLTIFDWRIFERDTLSEVNIAPENRWLENYLPFGKVYFSANMFVFRGDRISTFPIPHFSRSVSIIHVERPTFGEIGKAVPEHWKAVNQAGFLILVQKKAPKSST